MLLVSGEGLLHACISSMFGVIGLPLSSSPRCTRSLLFIEHSTSNIVSASSENVSKAFPVALDSAYFVTPINRSKKRLHQEALEKLNCHVMERLARYLFTSSSSLRISTIYSQQQMFLL